MNTTYSIILIATLSALVLIGIILILSYFLSNKGKTGKNKKQRHLLSRHPSNPTMSPQAFKDWEAGGTFNPAAIKDDEGFVHLLYRAVGADGVSRIGHAKSIDGKNVAVRTAYPVYAPVDGFDIPNSQDLHGPRIYAPVLYPSGGSWGGCEDPRAVRIGDRVYMTYVAFQGWQSVRIAITSIKTSDLKKGHWKWSKPRYVSPANSVNKNWVLFPEKINGKFAILHTLSPAVRIDYLDSLDSIYDKSIKSIPPSGGRPDHWDNWVRGAGPPPIKTSLGWLLLYHAMDKKDPNKYKLGAMILDMDEPTKVLYRSPQPILTPEMPYENDGKPGVVYASGALIIGEELVVYYGGGDRHVCVAHTDLKKLLNWLVEYGAQE